MSLPRLTKEQAAIIGAYTGIAAGPFDAIHEYAEKVLGHPVWSHQFGDKAFCDRLATASKQDFLAICAQ
ncbi:DUF7736 domain-containing protein [Brucella pituitosa]|uniref:DUF7736 domain-containing protein n=1 Tax=Brucella pituitosa TaxID=571256 RepID=UPI003F4ADF1E